MPISPGQLLAGRQMAVENELVKVASACENYGYELALLKIAETEEKAKEEMEEEKKEKEGGSPALSEDEKKEASAMGMYAFEGFINKLAHAGQVVYGDPAAYIRALAEENGAYEKVAFFAEGLTKAKGLAKSIKEKIAPSPVSKPRAAYNAVKNFGQDVGGMYTHPSRMLDAPGANSYARDLAVRGVAGALPGAAVGAGVGALASDDAGTGALYGAGIGALGGAGAGMGAHKAQAAWNATKNFGKDLGGMYAHPSRMVAPVAEGQMARQMALRGAAGALPGAAIGAGTGALVSDDAGTGALYGAGIGALGGAAAGMGAYKVNQGVQYLASKKNAAKAASGSVLDLLVASREQGILSQY
jgi:hypothetical protein